MVNEIMRVDRENILGARSDECSEERQRHTIGYKSRWSKPGLVEVSIEVLQVCEGSLYLHSKEKSLRSQRALLLNLTEICMWNVAGVLGMSIRMVVIINEKLLQLIDQLRPDQLGYLNV